MIGGRFTADNERLPLHLPGGYCYTGFMQEFRGHFAIEAARFMTGKYAIMMSAEEMLRN